MKTAKFIWATTLCLVLGMGIASCGDENEEIEPSPDKEAEENVNRHECVDLGLSVKWATCNVGASSPEDYGDYYAWGETETKSTYNWNNYKWSINNVFFNKYCLYSNHGAVDNKTVLESSDDVAHVQWGGSWRIPTIEEIEELANNCTWTWTNQNGKDGYKVTASNGNSIFLPAAGWRDGNYLKKAGSQGYYWSSSLNASTDSPYELHIWYYVDWGGLNNRYRGYSVRPVCDIE